MTTRLALALPWLLIVALLAALVLLLPACTSGGHDRGGRDLARPDEAWPSDIRRR